MFMFITTASPYLTLQKLTMSTGKEEQVNQTRKRLVRDLCTRTIIKASRKLVILKSGGYDSKERERVRKRERWDLICLYGTSS